MKRVRVGLLLALCLVPLWAFAQETANFTPLTSIPGLTDMAGSKTLGDFLNNVYRICIGLAAVLAVLQLIRAGIMYMLGDSVTEKKEAKNLIGLAVMGLVLVLSPTIMFGLINKDILTLKIDGLGDLRIATAEDEEKPVVAGECAAYKQMKNDVEPASSCSALGTGWEDIPASCCTPAAGKKCCGNKNLPDTKNVDGKKVYLATLVRNTICGEGEEDLTPSGSLTYPPTPAANASFVDGLSSIQKASAGGEALFAYIKFQNGTGRWELLAHGGADGLNPGQDIEDKLNAYLDNSNVVMVYQLHNHPGKLPPSPPDILSSALVDASRQTPDSDTLSAANQKMRYLVAEDSGIWSYKPAVGSNAALTEGIVSAEIKWQEMLENNEEFSNFVTENLKTPTAELCSAKDYIERALTGAYGDQTKKEALEYLEIVDNSPWGKLLALYTKYTYKELESFNESQYRSFMNEAIAIYRSVGISIGLFQPNQLAD